MVAFTMVAAVADMAIQPGYKTPAGPMLVSAAMIGLVALDDHCLNEAIMLELMRCTRIAAASYAAGFTMAAWE